MLMVGATTAPQSRNSKSSPSRSAPRANVSLASLRSQRPSQPSRVPAKPHQRGREPRDASPRDVKRPHGSRRPAKRLSPTGRKLPPNPKRRRNPLENPRRASTCAGTGDKGFPGKAALNFQPASTQGELDLFMK